MKEMSQMNRIAYDSHGVALVTPISGLHSVTWRVQSPVSGEINPKTARSTSPTLHSMPSRGHRLRGAAAEAST